MKKIKTSLCLFLVINISSCKQSDEETKLLQDAETTKKSADINHFTGDSNEIQIYNNSLFVEEPKFPPIK